MGNSLLIKQSNLQYPLILKNAANLKIIITTFNSLKTKNQIPKKKQLYISYQNGVVVIITAKHGHAAHGRLQWQEPLTMDLAGNKA